MIRLETGDWRATLAPEQGGAMLSLDWQALPVFRRTPKGATDILETACFPLVPYANRIADGRFTFEGRSVQLKVLDRFAPHAIHGDGWLRPWTVDSCSADAVSMTLDWAGDPDNWPWPWRALQRVSLSSAGLDVFLSVVNTGHETMPAGLGLHPYFHRYVDSRLSLTSTGVLATDTQGIPDRLIKPAGIADWSPGLSLAQAPFVDHAYAGWDGEAHLFGGGRHVVMRARPLTRWVQIYAPVGADFFCVEPMTHCPNAANAPTYLGEIGNGFVALAPDEVLSLHMTVTNMPGGAVSQGPSD